MMERFHKALSAFHKGPRYPVAVVSTLGLIGFLLDYLWKPVSTSGLIMLGLMALPWLMKIIRVKKGTVAGWEFELAQSSIPAETGERLALELQTDATDELGEQPPNNAEGDVINDGNPGPAVIQNEPVLTPFQRSHVDRVAQAYVAEGLVFQELQREFGGTVQREVKVGPYAVDGIVFGPSGPVAVEVKLFAAGKIVRARLIDAAARLLQLSSFGGEKYSNLRPLLAIVVRDVDSSSDNWRRRLREINSEFSSIDIRVFLLDELLRKYGMSEIS